MQPTAIYL